MPAVISNVQKHVLKNQFKTAYSKFSQAIFKTQASMGSGVACSYWLKNPYPPAECVETHPIYGGCTKYKDLPSDYNGLMNECIAFEEELFTKTFKVAKFCENNSLANGCLTNSYRGIDKVKAENNPNAEFPPNPNSAFSDNNIKSKFSSWILSDGTLIIKYGNYKSNNVPIFAIDINGHKGPNKWGYDIFTFQLLGDQTGITKIQPIYFATEKGGLNPKQMIEEAFLK